MEALRIHSLGHLSCFPDFLHVWGPQGCWIECGTHIRDFKATVLGKLHLNAQQDPCGFLRMACVEELVTSPCARRVS